ncbi:MAG: hypothetical protein U9N51_04055 [Bacteroidota bacterium]|nr:hypothetical protein [Bacteroidota bacterium]
MVLEVLSDSITKDAARLHYNIGEKSTILNWMRAYAGIKMKTAGVDPIPIMEDMKNNNDKSELEKKVKDLKEKLKYAELKSFEINRFPNTYKFF